MKRTRNNVYVCLSVIVISNTDKYIRVAGRRNKTSYDHITPLENVKVSTTAVLLKAGRLIFFYPYSLFTLRFFASFRSV